MTTNKCCETCQNEYNDYIRSTSFQSKQDMEDRTDSLFILQNIAKKYGGTVKIDLETDTLFFNVPKESEVSCALEVQDAMAEFGSDVF